MEYSAGVMAYGPPIWTLLVDKLHLSLGGNAVSLLLNSCSLRLDGLSDV
jgi:hypothetical protein